MSEIADELSQRASPSHLKERAREYVSERGSKFYDKASTSPTALATLGGLIGATVGMLWGRSRQKVRYEERPSAGYEYRYGYGYRPRTTEGDGHLKERAKEAAGDLREKRDELKDKAAELQERAVEKKDELKAELRYRADRMKTYPGRLSESFERNPLLFALGAAAAGAIFASFIPLSRREQELMHPMKERAVEQVKSAAESVKSGVKEKLEQQQPPIQS